MAKTPRIFTDLDAFLPTLKKLREQGRSLVLTQGSFDMVHIGHARYCAEAKSFGDVLCVGVDSDEKVRARKGPDRPVVPEAERLEMLTHLRSVDYVILKPINAAKLHLLKTIRPDVLVATRATYSPAKLKELEQWCGKVVVLEPMATTSTSAKIRLLQMGAAKKIGSTLTQKLIHSIEEVLQELKGEDSPRSTTKENVPHAAKAR